MATRRGGSGGGGAGSFLGFVVLAVVVLGASLAAGYFLSGGRAPSGPPATPPAPVTASASTDDSAPTQVASTHRPGLDQDYTAPGAPRISIHEIKPKPPTQSTAKANQDSEASQEGPTAPPDNSNTSGLTSPVTSSTTTPSTPTDQDYETTTPPSTAPGGETQPSGAYKVQVGSFEYARNAHAFADALRNRGYTVTTITERSNGQTVYHVQTGAFRTPEAANRAKDELQRYGFPAFVAPADQ